MAEFDSITTLAGLWDTQVKGRWLYSFQLLNACGDSHPPPTPPPTHTHARTHSILLRLLSLATFILINLFCIMDLSISIVIIRPTGFFIAAVTVHLYLTIGSVWFLF